MLFTLVNDPEIPDAVDPEVAGAAAQLLARVIPLGQSDCAGAVAVGDVMQLLANVIPFGQRAVEPVVVVVVVVEVDDVVPQAANAALVAFPASPSAVRPFEVWNAMTADWVPRPNDPSTVKFAASQTFNCVWRFITLWPVEPRFKVVDPKSEAEKALADTANAKANASAATAKNFFFIIKINFNYLFLSKKSRTRSIVDLLSDELMCALLSLHICKDMRSASHPSVRTLRKKVSLPHFNLSPLLTERPSPH